MVKVFSGICPILEPQVDAIYHGCMHWFSIKKNISLSTEKEKPRVSYVRPTPQKQEHSTQFDLNLSCPPGLRDIWDFIPLGCGPVGTNPLRLSANTFFKQTARGKHILSTQYPVLPKYAGFLTLPFLAGESIEKRALSVQIHCPSYHTSIPHPKTVSEIQASLERGKDTIREAE